MSSSTFDRETLLDLVVNAIPLGIILFFMLVFVVLNPFGSAPVQTALQFTIMLVMFVALGILSYYSARAISNAEKELEEEPAEFAEPQAAFADAEIESEYDEEDFADATEEIDESDSGVAIAADAEESAEESEAADEPPADADDEDEKA
ncbi:DUF6684 family protein [Natronomonas sp. EA1]|uniref:DUF6684 family protein n=1 Tax=Natronomonas sp. EA1 TaxID=3421655 RepID=UPI003EC0C526